MQGHTARNMNLQGKLSNEIAKNFSHRRRLRGVALAIRTVIYLSNIIRRKREEIRETQSCVEFSNVKEVAPRKESVLDERPILFTLNNSSSFEESNSFDRDNSFEQEAASCSFPVSPSRRSSISSRIPRPKPTTARQHIEEIRKSIGKPIRKAESSVKINKDTTHRSRVEQLNAVGAAYQKVYGGDESKCVSDLKPPSVTLRTRPSSAKESSNPRRSSIALGHVSSLPSSPKHGAVSALAPGVKKRMPLSKCISVDESVKKRSGSISSSPAASSYRPSTSSSRRSSVSDGKKAGYRASYPNRNSSYFAPSLDTITAKPRLPKNGSSKPDDDKPARQEKQVSDRSSSPALTQSRRNSVVRKRTPSISSASKTSERENLRKTKDTIERIANISNLITETSKKQNSKELTKRDEAGSADEGNISIVTKTNKTENIKILLGKTVDKSVETSTTVSVTIDGDKTRSSETNQAQQKPFGLGRSLLTKVKQLAEEIETLAMFTSPGDKEQADVGSARSFPHSSSMPVLRGGEVMDFDAEHDSAESSTSVSQDSSSRSQWDQDCFSETEYLSLNTKSHRLNTESTTDDDMYF